ncbi:MAG TPA: class II aldolase/adducin family protein [Bryobacteraceae bacterium]|jgi:rhamnose utilization protein RhaD (predicted bifunctional aldolase and dehydrogenase)
MTTQSDFLSLRTLSARIGRDPLLTQANSGNTSIKLGPAMWIKASGKWLADALQDDIFVPVDLAMAADCLRWDSDPAAFGPSSSETAMHAVIRQRVVVHVHSVNAIAHAIRADGRTSLRSKLAGLRWEWIPYAPSGLPLAKKIHRALQKSQSPDIFVLSNHGLVVCGDTCGSVAALLHEVENRLALTPRSAPGFDSKFLFNLASGSDWRLPEHTRLHALATDPVSRNILSNGVIHPVQTVLPGGFSSWTPFYSGLYSEASKGFHESGGTQKFRIVEDKGVLLNEKITSSEIEMLIGLAEVVQRIDSSASIRYLTQADLENSGARASRSHGFEPLALSA